MTKKQSKNEIKADKTMINCKAINEKQNKDLNEICTQKFNVLPCKCSGCETDDVYPILSSPNDAVLLNTGYDGSGGFLSNGSDFHWEVRKGSSSSWKSAKIVSDSLPNSWVRSPFESANWISFSENGSGGGSTEMYFRYRFNLNSSINPATFFLMMDFYADNRILEIKANNIEQSTQPNGSNILPQVNQRGYIADSQVRIKLDNSWQRCNNEIIVHVRNSTKDGAPGDPGGLLVQNSIEISQDMMGCNCNCECSELELPDIHPCISVKWGDSKCDCLETNDMEILCITVCNCYSNISFHNFYIGKIQVTDMTGKPAESLPAGTPSVQVIPSGPICFGNITACTDSDQKNCVSRELVLKTSGAIGKKYRLSFSGICFDVSHPLQSEQCFIMELCQD